MDQVQKYPLDFDALKKGDMISVSQQEKIFTVKQTDRRFVWQSMALKARIEKEMAMRGLPVTVRSDHGALVICIDKEASEYNDRQRIVALRRFGRAHRRNLAVDRTKLDRPDLDKHDRQNGIFGAVLAMALKTRRRMVLKAATRQTPVIEGPPASDQ